MGSWDRGVVGWYYGGTIVGWTENMRRVLKVELRRYVKKYGGALG